MQRPCPYTPHGRSLRESWAVEPRARPVVLQFAFFNLQIEACDDGKRVPSRRQRRDVGFSWLGRPDTDTCFTLPQRGHAFPRNIKVVYRFAYNPTSIGTLTYSEVITHT